MPIARYQLPNGKIARFEVEAGTTPEQVEQLAQEHFGLNQENSAQPTRAKSAPAVDPTTGMSGVEKFLAGVGQGIASIPRGIGQRTGLIPQSSINESIRLDAPLLNTGAGKIGSIVGNVALGIPTAFIPGANTLTGASIIGGAFGAAQPTAEGESPFWNTALSAAFPSALRGLTKYSAKPIGYIHDLISGQAPTVRASAIAKEAAGSDLQKLKKILPNSAPGLSAAQATKEGGIDNTLWQALAKFGADRDLTEYFPRLAAKQENVRQKTLSGLAGAPTQAGARSHQLSSEKFLNKITNPMLENALDSANLAAKKLPPLTNEANKFSAAAAQKVEDVRRMERLKELAHEASKNRYISERGGAALPRIPAKYTYPAELGKRAEQVQQRSADASLAFGDAARLAKYKADSLAAHGFKPLNTEALISNINAKIKDPKIGVEDINKKVLSNVNDKIAEWTANGGGIIDAAALHEIRKGAVNSTIETLLPNASAKAKAKRAAGLLAEVRPLIDDAFKKAGGDLRPYNQLFAKNKHTIDQSVMAAKAMKLYKDSPKKFIDLVGSDDIKAVEKVFGPNSFDFVREMGGKAAPLKNIANQLKRDADIKKQAAAGSAPLNVLLKKYGQTIDLPNPLDAKIAITRRLINALQGNIQEKSLQKLTNAVKSGKNMAELLNALPATEKIKVLRALKSGNIIRPTVLRGTQAALPPIVITRGNDGRDQK